MFSIGGHSHWVNHGGAGHVTGLHRELFGPIPRYWVCAGLWYRQLCPPTPPPVGTHSPHGAEGHHGGVWLPPGGVGSETQLPILLKRKAQFITHRLRHE